tara:strand:- start:149 stop:358 length:210 start_codon:yes stop_codon:yes gene_type:complete
MKIKVNGEEIVIKSDKKIIPLIETIRILGYTSNSIVVELNKIIINSEGWKYKQIKDGDNLEIVSIVGGG